MSTTRTTRSLPLIALTLACVLLVSPVASAVTQAQADKHLQKARDAREAAKKANALAARLVEQSEALDSKIDSSRQQLQALRPKIEATTDRRARLEREVAQLREAVSIKETLIRQTAARLKEQKRLLSNRMAETYKQGDLYLLEMFLGARDLSDLVVRASFAQKVIESNQAIARDLGLTKANLETEQAALDRDLANVNTKKLQVITEERSLRSLQEQERRQLSEQRSAKNAKLAMVAQNRQNAAKLLAQAIAEEAESAKIEAELRRASQGSGTYSGGVMMMPAQGRASSEFGYRIHPISGKRKLHAGLDIAAPTGTPIVAAASGTVFYSGWRGGYGNTIMIDHGNGVVTLYAHQSQRIASAGQRVTKGQLIGRIGTTGFSTGPHLHFEVRVNGAPVNPRKYF